jgi:hypothetical protein
MRRPIVLLATLLVLPILFVAGCARHRAGSPDTAASSTALGASPTAPASGTGGASGQPADDGGSYQVRYGWAVPSTRTEVVNRVPVPLTPPPGIPLPYLMEIHTGDHAQESPGYGRISFYFRGAFPGYNFNYAAQVLTEAKGDPISLEGNAFLRIQFVDAQAHNNSGASTVRSAANQHIGFRNLRSYRPAGDFEGHLSFGLGIQVAPGSDQVLPIRVGELKKPDGNGGFFYVVAFDAGT